METAVEGLEAGDAAPPRAQAHTSRALLVVVASLLWIGLASRLSPFLDLENRLFWQFPTEDGYLMLTIARNLALGHGMSIASGTIPTNGTQPLFNLVEAASFFVVGGDKRLGVMGVLGIQLALAVLAGFTLYRFGRLVLAERPALAAAAAPLAAAAWFASPKVVAHGMNALETGLYVTLVLLSVKRFYAMWLAREAGRPDLVSAASVGALLGVTFWARIDAVFLIAVVTGANLLWGIREGRHTVRARLVESCVMGGISVVLASPWLIHNAMRFGHVMPISGTAQSASASFASNAATVPPALFEYATLLLPIPHRFESLVPVLVVTTVLVLGYAALGVRVARRAREEERMAFWLAGGLGLLLIGYYGFAFGAPHFVSRYLFPLSPFAALFTACMLCHAHQRFAEHPAARAGTAAALGVGLVLAIGLNARLFLNGTEHTHRSVVEWTQRHVPETAWVGAPQSGTLGFFHDRTVNLDGKVNPVALEHRLDRTLGAYLVEGEFGPNRQRIEYVVDWAIIVDRLVAPPIGEHFERIDAEGGVGVLQRRRDRS